jgi:hypothetical protein
MLIAAGVKGDTCRRAYIAIRIAVAELDAFIREAIDDGRLVIRPAVATQMSVAKIV